MIFKISRTLPPLILFAVLTVAPNICARAYAEDSAEPPAAGTSNDSKARDSKAPMRNFYAVLEDLLSDFEYDLKNGQVTGLKDLAIRNIATSENVPPSFKQHLELALTERILKTSRTRIVQCLPCRAKRTTLNGDQVTITSAESNPVELARIAKISGIEHFMDVAFSYQPSGMVISMTIIEPETGGVLWSRSYNSETSRASAQRRGVDYSQVDEARRASEYQPTVQYRAVFYYLFEPNVAGSTGSLGVGFRMMERYDNRRKEVGFELDYMRDASSIVSGPAPAGEVNLYSGLNLTLLFVHAWNLIGSEENYNVARGSVFAAIGGTYASGFLGGLVRGGYEWRLAKHWAVSANVGYRPTSTAFLSGSAAGKVSGAEFGVGISHLF